MTCGPLEGVFVCLCKSLTGENLIVKAQGHLDLHLGHEAHRLDVLSHNLYLPKAQGKWIQNWRNWE
jgi:hypothetical protein